jgi:hypothetical protein
MTPTEALQQHQQICDELHALALEENRFLQQHQRTPEAELLARKRGLLARMEESLAALRAIPRGDPREPALRGALDKARSRILQILSIDKENEQLLLRHSLGRGPVSPPTPVDSGMLQRIYARHS